MHTMMRPFTIIRVATLLLPIFIAGHPLLKGNHMNNSEMLRCGVENPDERAVAERDKAVAFHHFQRRRQPNTNNNIFRENRLEKVIPVCFHIPQSIFSYIFFFLGGYIFRRDIQSQLDHLNTAFSTASCCDARESWCQGECSIDTRIRFELAKQTRTGELLSDETTSDASSRRACIERVHNISWTSFYYRGDEVRDMKTALRKGDASVLNIYLSSPTAGRRDVLGFATYPWEYENDPAMDGVVVRRSTMPEGTYDNAGEGDTLVHEVGHWLGLYHTFAFGCSPGDGIADTNAEASPHTFGCSPGRDTCPLHPGLDPIHNFMDYSRDSCLYRWTLGQVDVMHACYDVFRSGNPVNLSPVWLTDGIESNPYTLVEGQSRFFVLEGVPANSNVTCIARADNGNLDLYLDWDDDGMTNDDFGCQAVSDATTEVCSLVGGPGTLYAMVHGTRSVIDFAVTCTAAALA